MSSGSSNLRLLRLRLRVMRRLRDLLGRTASRDMARFVPFYRQIWSDAAAAIGASFEEIDPDLWQITLKDKKTIIHNFRTAIDNPVVLHLAGDKALAYRMMAASGLTVPNHRLFDYRRIQAAQTFMDQNPGSCFVVKPAWGTSGSAGVTTRIRNARQCAAAVALSSIYHEQVLIERQVCGETYRVLVLDGKPLHVVKRKGLIVVGNGRSTVRELAEEKAGKEMGASLRLMLDDPGFETDIRCQGLTTASVPDRDERVLIRAHLSGRATPSELRTVFTDDASAEVSEAVLEQAVQAAAALHVTFAGVDIVTVDPAIPLDRSGGAIIEINTTPGLHHHYRGGVCLGNSPTVAVLEYLLNNNAFRYDSKFSQ